LVVVSAIISIAHTVRIANKEGSYLVGDTKVDDLSTRFMALIPNTALIAPARLVLGTLQLVPATRILVAAGLFLSQLSKLLMALAFERADTTTGDNEGLLGIGADSSEVDFSQVYRRLVFSWSVLRTWYLDAHMQFKAPVPDQGTCSCFFWQGKRQDQRGTTTTHRQDHPSLLVAHSLSRPGNGIEAFGMPGILHLHLWVGLAKLTCGFDSGKKGMNNHLNRLAMQSKAAFGGLLQFIASRPVRMFCSRLFMPLHAEVPDLGGFHLGGFQSGKLASR
jgi:hypothetical protein